MLKKYIVFALLIFAACNKSENPVNNNNINTNPTGSFTVNIEGNAWAANQNAVFASSSTTDTITVLLITAAQNIGTSGADGFGISVTKIGGSNTILTGQYMLDGSVPAALTFVRTISNVSESYAAISGQVTISEVTSTHIKGTFNAVLRELTDPNKQITLTNGAFNALITVQQ